MIISVLFGELSKTCFTAFETIKFYSIQKKFVPICILIIGFVFEQVAQILYFFSGTNKKASHICFLLQVYSHVPVSIESPATRTFAFCCSCPWGHTFTTSKENDQYFDPFPLPHPVSHSPSRVPLLLPPLTPMLKNEQQVYCFKAKSVNKWQISRTRCAFYLA